MRSPLRVLLACLSAFVFVIFLYSFANEGVCKTGCGNLTEPLFMLAHSTFGVWGVRALLLLIALLFAIGAVRSRANEE
jgi:hypothetical protein